MNRSDCIKSTWDLKSIASSKSFYGRHDVNESLISTVRSQTTIKCIFILAGGEAVEHELLEDGAHI